MSYWCTGELKVRGRYEDVLNFLQKELYVDKPSRGKLVSEPKVEVTEYGIFIDAHKYGLWFKNVCRSYLEGNIEIYITSSEDGDKNDQIITANLGMLQSAYSIDVDSWTKLSKEYQVDFKTYAYARGNNSNIDFEVRKGDVVLCCEIGFNDYVWECTNPSI